MPQASKSRSTHNSRRMHPYRGHKPEGSSRLRNERGSMLAKYRYQATSITTTSDPEILDNRVPTLSTAEISSDLQDLLHVSSQICAQKPKSHKWTAKELQVLCLLKRCYSMCDTDVARILGSLFPLQFKIGMVRSQYNELKTFTGSAQQKECFAAAWVYNIRDLQSRFAEYFTKIEEAAESSKVLLERRTRDCMLTVEKALQYRLKDPKLFKKLEARQFHWQKEPSPQFVELRSDSEVDELTRPRDECDFYPQDLPSVLFRYVGARSAGRHMQYQIRAGNFAQLPEYPVPKSLSTDALLFEAANHIHRCDTSTSLISTTNSFIWVLAKAIQGGSPQDIAAKFGVFYALDAAKSAAHTSVYHSKKLVCALKKGGMYDSKQIRAENGTTLDRTRYTGAFEYLILGEVKRDSIIATVPLYVIEDLAQRCEATSKLLRLEYLRKTKTLYSARKKLAADELKFDRRIGLGVAKMILLFGVTAAGSLSVIASFVYELLQNFEITVPSPSYDIEQGIEIITDTLRLVTPNLTSKQHLEAYRAVKDGVSRRGRDTERGRRGKCTAQARRWDDNEEWIE